MASSARSLRSEFETRQPTSRREKTSITSATYTKPRHIATGLWPAFSRHQLRAGMMAFGAGVSRDALSSYLPAFFIGGVLCIVAALSLWLLRDRSRPVTLAAQLG
jgi:hypothetical protein